MANIPIRIGLIGTSGIADGALAPAFAKATNAQLWSVLSRDSDRATVFARKYKAVAPKPAHSSFNEFLADPMLQGVVIASPDKLHAEQIIACAKAGKHVLVEKPFVTSRDEGAAAIKACREAKVKLGVAMHLRWHSGHRKLHEMATKQKALGAIRHIRAQWTWRAADDSNWRAHQEMGRWWGLAGTGPHCLDMIRWFAGFGKVVEQRSLVTKNVWKGPHDETAVISLEFDNGITAECITSVLFNGPGRFEIYGQDNYALCEGTLAARTMAPFGNIRIGDSSMDFTPMDPYAGEITDFANAIRDNREPEVNGEAGLIVIEDLLKAMPT
jgi:1,5-anhydro-D-fructose reductase (1,5-anhydro-D-mannitol-forming)